MKMGRGDVCMSISLLLGIAIGSAIIPAILITIASLIFNSAQRKREKITNIKPLYVFGISFFLVVLFVFIIGSSLNKSMNIVFAGIPIIINFFAIIYWLFAVFTKKANN